MIKKKIKKMRTLTGTRGKKELLSNSATELISVIEDNFDKEGVDKFKDFIYQLAHTEELKFTAPLWGERTDYGGDLSTGLWSTLASGRGVYNPESLSHAVMSRMMKDPQIAMGFAMLSEPIRSLNFVIDCKDEYTKILVKQALKKIWGTFIIDTLRGIMYGFSAFEKVFKYEHIRVIDEDKDGKLKTVFNDIVVIYDKLKNVHPSTITLELDKKENYNGFSQSKKDGRQPKLPKRKTAWYVYNFEFGNYYGKGLLRNVYKYWYWGELLYQFMLRYFEQCGTPPIIVTVPKGYSLKPDGTKQDNLELGLRVGRSLLSNSIAVLPYDPDKNTKENRWQIDRMVDKERGGMFVETIQHINTMKLLGIFVPPTVADEQLNERDVFFFTQEGLIRSVEDFVNTQIIPPLIDFNVNPEKQVPCLIRFDKMSYAKKALYKELLIEQIRSLRVLQREGIKPLVVPDIRGVSEQLEVPLVNYDEAFDDSNAVFRGKTERPGDVESDFDFDKDKSAPRKGRGEAKKEDEK